jgi:hypothetical protein
MAPPFKYVLILFHRGGNGKRLEIICYANLEYLSDTGL